MSFWTSAGERRFLLEGIPLQATSELVCRCPSRVGSLVPHGIDAPEGGPWAPTAGSPSGDRLVHADAPAAASDGAGVAWTHSLGRILRYLAYTP